MKRFLVLSLALIALVVFAASSEARHRRFFCKRCSAKCVSKAQPPVSAKPPAAHPTLKDKKK